MIDDYDHGKGQERFQGDLIHFGPGHDYPDWDAVQEYFAREYGVDFGEKRLQK